MNCKDFEKSIPNFIEQNMDYATLKEFSGHMSSCTACKEELTIQFLVEEGLQRLEEGDAFDLQREFDIRLGAAKKKLKFHRGVLIGGLFLEFIAIAGIAIVIIWMIL